MNEADDTRKTAQAAPMRCADGKESWENAVREAFDEVRASDELKRKTLGFIEERRERISLSSGSGESESPAPPAEGCDPRDTASSRPALRRDRRFKVVRRALAAAACILAVAAGVLGYRLYSEPAAYVGIDVNPSLELSVNAFGTVVEAQALNEDAGRVLEAVTLEGKSYDDALDTLFDSDSLSPYINDNAYVDVSVTTSDDALAARLQETSDACLRNASCEGSCHRVDEATRETAHEAGMGVGKYEAAQELMELDSSVTLEECAKMSMRELRDRIDACSEEGESGHHGAQQGGSGQGDASGQAVSDIEQGEGKSGKGGYGHHGE